MLIVTANRHAAILERLRKIPTDLAEASVSGAGLSIVAALCMIFLFGMELRSMVIRRSTTTSIVVDKSSDGDFLLLDFNLRYPNLVVNFYAPWCYWSNRLKPLWDKAAKIITERYDPETDGRILLGKVDCTEAGELCRGEDHGQHEHESYYGDRDTESLAMEAIVASMPLESEIILHLLINLRRQ